jgi:uncharacterized protein (DUF427 family)
MSKSPGHQKSPNHRIREEHLHRQLVVEVEGVVVADSSSVIKVDEDNHPARYYFPRSAVTMEKLRPSDTTTECPFKGTASYYELNLGERRLKDAVWEYADPYDEHRDLKGRLAFYDDKYPEIQVRLKV